MPEKTDDELVEETQSGNKDAFETLVIRYRPGAVRFAASLVGPDTAEDIAQEAFAKVYLRLGQYKTGTAFKSWLFTIIRNTGADYRRKMRDALPLDAAYHITGTSTPQEDVARAEEWRALRLGWNKLTKDAQCALYLYAFEKMSYGEIAAVMDKNTAQIKMLLYRARGRLRKEMDQS